MKNLEHLKRLARLDNDSTSVNHEKNLVNLDNRLTSVNREDRKINHLGMTDGELFGYDDSIDLKELRRILEAQKWEYLRKRFG